MPAKFPIVFACVAALASGCSALTKRGDAQNVVVRLQSPGDDPVEPAKVGQLSDRPTQAMTLRDVIAWSLRESDAIRTLSGEVTVTGVTSVDVPIAEAQIGEAVGAFNPVLSTGYLGGQVSEPPSSFFGPGLAAPTRYDEGTFTAKVTQPLITGGAASIGFGPPLGYLYFPDGVSSGAFNPAYSADLFVRLNQPILRGGGIRRTLAPIEIAKARTDQTVWEVQAGLNSQIRSLAQAYWDLQAAFTALRAIDSVIPLAQESVRLERLRFDAEQVIRADVARAEVQLEELIRGRHSAVQELYRRGLQLNQLIGISPAEMIPIMPVDIPVATELAVDLNVATDVALSSNPELASFQRKVDIRALELQVARRDRLPSVNAFAEGRTSGLSDNVGASLSQSGSFDYSSWTLGLTVDYPLGNGQALSRLKGAEQALIKDQILLRRSQQQVAYRLAGLGNDLDAAWRRHSSARRQVEQSQEWLRLSGLRYAKPLPTSRNGNWLLLALVDYQNAMRGYVEAVTTAASTLAEYNTVLARLDEAQGISLERWKVQFAEEDQTQAPPSPYRSYHFGNDSPMTGDKGAARTLPERAVTPRATDSTGHEWGHALGSSNPPSMPVEGTRALPRQTVDFPAGQEADGRFLPPSGGSVAPSPDLRGHSFSQPSQPRYEFHRYAR